MHVTVSAAMPTQHVPIVLRYEGPDVDGGEMSIEDVIPVLQGFASAYGKIAGSKGHGINHRLTITGVERGSVMILLNAVEMARQASPDIALAANVATIAGGIVEMIIGVIAIKRHVKKQPHQARPSAGITNTVIIQNSENVTLQMPFDIYQVFREGILDQDLQKVAKPLAPGKVDAAEIELRSTNYPVRARIEAHEKAYFEVSDASVTETPPTWLMGQINSFHKGTRNGQFLLTDGSRVACSFIGEDSAFPRFLAAFAHPGLVRVWASAKLDENLKVTHMCITDVHVIQESMF